MTNKVKSNIISKMDLSKNSVAFLENKIDELLRDKYVISFLSKNINTAISVQHFINKKMELILRLADVATLKSLKELFESINHLEKESVQQKERIAHLEALLAAKTEVPKVAAPRKRRPIATV